MKKIILLLPLLLVLTGAYCQKFTVEEPDHDCSVMLVNGNTAARLEIQVPSNKARSGKIYSYSSIQGARSSIRIGELPTVDLLVRLNEYSKDPLLSLHLLKLDHRQGNRVVTDISLNILGDASRVPRKEIPLTWKLYGLKSMIISAHNLKPGEYALVIDDCQDSYNFFGVDK